LDGRSVKLAVLRWLGDDNGLLNRLRHIEAKPESRKYKSKRLTERTLKSNSMYQVEVAHIANV
jgi:hypothetical protein